MRARFLRIFLDMMINPNDGYETLIAESYFDKSHFLRDSKRFLGMTPWQFLDLNTSYLTATLRARKLVLGMATPCLDRLPA